MDEIQRERHIRRRHDRRSSLLDAARRPVARGAHRRALDVRRAAIVQGATIALPRAAGLAAVAPLLYCVFLLTNSTAAASLDGARALGVEHEQQGLLNLASARSASSGFLGGVVLVAGLLGPLGFGALLALLGVGTAARRRFRRSFVDGT